MMAAVLAGREAIATLIDLSRAAAGDPASGAGDPGRPDAGTRTPAEAAAAGAPQFDRFVDGLNRLPRPLLAFGCLALFAFAMIDPVGFARRMAGLKEVPEPLWWLLGGVVGFYFGAREAHHFRARTAPARPEGPTTPPAEANPALAAWRDVRQD
jgi:hypothetical protein